MSLASKQRAALQCSQVNPQTQLQSSLLRLFLHMPSQTRDWRLYLNDMMTFAERVIAYTESLNQSQFVADELTYSATLRNLELIGEVATHVPEEVRIRHSEIHWRFLSAIRDQLMRGNSEISDDALWNIITTDVPDLLPKLRAVSAVN